MAEYANWKHENAAGARPDSYLGAKRPFIQRVLGAHGIELKPDEERLSEAALERRRTARPNG